MRRDSQLQDQTQSSQARRVHFLPCLTSHWHVASFLLPHYAQRLVVPYAGVQLRIGFTKGLLTLPQDSTPVICIGPGTGVAPARAVVEARVHLGMKDNTLYFGHRASGKDEHYVGEWISLAESGRLTYRVTASRDGPEGTPRVYVQDLIRQDTKRIWQLVHDKGAWVYISGCVRPLSFACVRKLTSDRSSNKMPAGVRAALVDIAQEEGEMGEEEARAYVDGLEREERLLEECWS
jgi:sulfite reductase alpha subunit-like flavoprotein